MNNAFFRGSVVCVALIACLASCKSTSTDPQSSIRLYSNDPDTTSKYFGTVTFTVAVLDANGYGIAGAYIDFTDPLQNRDRLEGPSNGTGIITITDTVPTGGAGGNFEFDFIGEHNGTRSPVLRKWLNILDTRAYAIDSVGVTCWDSQTLYVQWKRSQADIGTDTVFATKGGFKVLSMAESPNSTVFLPLSAPGPGPWTIIVRNAYAASTPFVWAAATQYINIRMYENDDPNPGDYAGVSLQQGLAYPIDDPTYQSEVDLVLAKDPGNPASGLSLVSPSLSNLSGFTGGRTTYVSNAVPFINNGEGLRQFLSYKDLTSDVSPNAQQFTVPLPDSLPDHWQMFSALTADGHYARVAVGPVTRDLNMQRYVDVDISYQTTANLPYAGRPRRRH